MGNTITIASTIILGFGTIVSVPEIYDDYHQYHNFATNYHAQKNMGDFTFESTNNEIFQVSVLNTDNAIFDELTSFIHSVVNDSKPLDSDISRIVSEHFWELI